MNIASMSGNLHNWAVSLHPNEVQLIGVTIGALTTIITACLAVWIAFKQLTRQFENKVIADGWSDFQSRLFTFSNSITDYSSYVQWLQYMLTSQDNSLVNGGSKSQYRQNKWQELFDSYTELQKSYVGFLRSFETHEVVFLPLSKMMKTFQEQYRSNIDEVSISFMEKIFPEMYGSKENYSFEELKPVINKHWQDLTDVQIYLDDFRVELQNITVGKVLNKKVKGRNTSKNYKKLTRKGLK